MQFLFFIMGVSIVGFIFSVVWYIMFTKQALHELSENKPLAEEEKAEVEEEVAAGLQV